MEPMADVIAHPFRLAGTSVATVDDETDAGARQEIAVLATTPLGERDMVPEYGLSDPTFRDGIDVPELNAGLATFGPPGVVVTSVSAGVPDAAGITPVTLTFDYDPA